VAYITIITERFTVVIQSDCWRDLILVHTA